MSFFDLGLWCWRTGRRNETNLPFNPLLHRLFLDYDIISIFRQLWKNQEKFKLSFKYFWKYYGKCNICSKRANAPFSITFSNTWYFKGVKRRYYGEKLFRPMEVRIVHCIYGGVPYYNFKKNIVFISRKINFILANSRDSDEMLRYPFRDFWSANGLF